MASTYHGGLLSVFLWHPTEYSSPGDLFCLVQDMGLQMVPITWELGAIVLCLSHTTLGHHAFIYSGYTLHHNAP